MKILSFLVGRLTVNKANVIMARNVTLGLEIVVRSILTF